MRLRCHFFTAAVLVFGHAGDSGRHAHRSLQLVLALGPGFRLRRADGDEIHCDWALLAPQEPHRIRGEGGALAHLFLDPGPRQWKHWLAAGGRAKPPDAQLIALLSRAGAGEVSREQAWSLVQAWRSHCLPGLADELPGDRRIARAIACIDADPGAPDLNHRDLAERAHLSPSRFLALFREQVGMPVRNYVLWRRLLLAAELLERGESVTAAAHAAHFADAAHLSRSFRRVLGAAPSEMRMPGGHSARRDLLPALVG